MQAGDDSAPNICYTINNYGQTFDSFLKTLSRIRSAGGNRMRCSARMLFFAGETMGPMNGFYVPTKIFSVRRLLKI